MIFENSRSKVIKKLDYYIDNHLSEYSKLRNFDYGPQNRMNTSCLSPFITHGVINETEVINNALKKYSFSKNEKFIQEVLWRTYWKGWLELRPNVWADYLAELLKLRKDFENKTNYLEAIEGKTNIECFDEWVNELKNYNYLHNHTRMWFSSIWIFTLNLPWQLGAEFFMQHLYDGDPASNTLGWRWVAGVQTHGKHYLATEWNIKKFSNNRFQNIKLNENATPKVSQKSYPLIKQQCDNPKIIEKKNLLIFENNLSFEVSNFIENKFEKVYLISNIKENRSIELDEKLIKFKSELIKDQKKRLEDKSINCEIIDISEIKNINDCYGLYPSIGENLDYLNSNNLKINFLYRDLDQLAWQYCNKGFFNFKNYIPKIISAFN